MRQSLTSLPTISLRDGPPKNFGFFRPVTKTLVGSRDIVSANYIYCIVGFDFIASYFSEKDIAKDSESTSLRLGTRWLSDAKTHTKF